MLQRRVFSLRNFVVAKCRYMYSTRQNPPASFSTLSLVKLCKRPFLKYHEIGMACGSGTIMGMTMRAPSGLCGNSCIPGWYNAIVYPGNHMPWS